MVNTIAKKNKTLPTKFSVVFYEAPVSCNPIDILFNKGNKDYHRAFGFTGTVVHVGVRLGAKYYETTTDGTIESDYDPEVMLNNPRVVGFFEADISEVAEDSRRAAQFALANMVGRKLDIRGCLRYLRQTGALFKSIQQIDDDLAAAEQDQVALDPGNFSRTDKGIKFNLPFTCSTPANVCMQYFFNYEPCMHGHLAQSLCLSLTILQDMGWGEIYTLVDEVV